MKIYAVSKENYEMYRTSEVERIQKEIDSISDAQVVTEVKFSTVDKDFSIVDLALLGLLKNQYKTGKYITQNDLDAIENELSNIKKNEVETLGEVLSCKHRCIDTVDDIINIIKDINNYMMIYLTNEEELGRFIVRNLDIYKMPQSTLDNIYVYLNFKAIAEEYIFRNDLKVIGIEDIVLDISKNKDDILVHKLIEKEMDSKTTNAKKYENEDSQGSEEDFEFEGDE